MAGKGQHAGHGLKTPSQVTPPLWRLAQLLLTTEHVLFPWQLTEPEIHVAVALQDFIPPPPCEPATEGFAAKAMLLRGAGQAPLNAGLPRIAARASPLKGLGLAAWAEPTTETERRTDARTDAALVIDTSPYRGKIPLELPFENPARLLWQPLTGQAKLRRWAGVIRNLLYDNFGLWLRPLLARASA
jgi:hypothetical protein